MINNIYHMITIDRDTLRHILKTRIVKYNSQHLIQRHYILRYVQDEQSPNLFHVTNETFDNNIKQGESHAECVLEDDGQMLIHYSSVFQSPHPTSPFHPDNSFYPKLFDGYRIGPLYSTATSPICVDSHFMLPLMYNIEDGRVKVLNFYVIE